MLKNVGNFEGVNVYESGFISPNHAITLPPYGIFLSKAIYSKQKDLNLIKHEFGHFLQFRKLGYIRFYLLVGVPSFYSAIKASLFKSYNHQTAQVEIEANAYSFEYFKHPKNWPFKRFPIEKF